MTLSMKSGGVSLVVAGSALLAGSGSASAAYLEAIDGDLSNVYTAPTALTLTPNDSTMVSGSIAGILGPAGEHIPVDRDFFTVTVPAGQFLTAMFVREGTTNAGNGSFIGLRAGNQSVNPDAPVSTDLLGYYLYGSADIGTDILPDLATFQLAPTFPAAGFTPPLAAGQYTFWLQEGSFGTFSYNFEFQLSSVPEPTSLALLGLAGLATLRRRRHTAA